jgi:hypothetical protein
MLTAERLKQVLHYDPETGVFTRISTGKRCSHRTHGYLRIWVDTASYRANRLAWLYVYDKFPDGIIDHKDRDRANDAIANLREANCSLNGANMRLNKNNKSGFKGVHWVARKRRWQAKVKVNGSTKHLGYFEDAIDAHLAYAEGARKAFGEFAHAAQDRYDPAIDQYAIG